MKKSAALLLAGAMVLSPVSVLANDDLEARVVALEERVAVLESQLGLSGSDVPADDGDVDLEERGDLVFESDGCSLWYRDFEIVKDYQGGDAIVLYFDFANSSDRNRSAMMTFNVQVFQNGKETGLAVVAQSIPEYNDSVAQVMPGADPVRVAFISKLEDLSDVIVRISPLVSLGGDYIEIPLSLQ